MEEAKAHFRRAAEIAPQNPYSQLELGQIALAEKQFETARDHLERALLLNPNQSEAHAALAQVSLVLGDKASAKAHMAAARNETEYRELHDPLAEKVKDAGVTKAHFARRGNRLMRGITERLLRRMQKPSLPMRQIH